MFFQSMVEILAHKVFVFDSNADEDAVMEIAIASGAEDIEVADDGTIEVTTSPTHFESVLESFNKVGLKPEFAEVLQRPSTECPLTVDDADKVMQLLTALEELDDVHDVFTNAGFPEDK